MKQPDSNQKTLAVLVGIVVFMGAMAWAAVPFYNWSCKVTGFGGTTGVASERVTDHEILDRTIKVRFDGSVERGFPWEFKPKQREIELKIGEDALVFFEAYNPTSRPVAGQASYNVYPYDAGAYFIKVECFCFTEQVLQPGERVEMPVSFYVDPDMVNDIDAKYIRTITLGYTFHEIDLPEDQAARLETGQGASVN